MRSVLDAQLLRDTHLNDHSRPHQTQGIDAQVNEHGGVDQVHSVPLSSGSASALFTEGVAQIGEQCVFLARRQVGGSHATYAVHEDVHEVLV